VKSPGFFKQRETHNGRRVTGEKVIGKTINGKKVIGEKSK
jgi:ribosomal protein L34